MMRCIITFFALPIGIMTLSGCAGSGDKYPSLAIRDVERAEGRFDTGGPSANPSELAPAEVSADVLANLAELQSQARAAHADFIAATPRVTQLVADASSAPIASNRWADAQVALASLASIRSRTAVPLAEVDIMYAEATVEARAGAEISEARATITSMVADEDGTLAALRGQLPS